MTKVATDIEKEFDCFFSEIGFKRISMFIGNSPSFKNADYIDTGRKIIIELKILDKDYFNEGGIIDRFHSLVPKPVDINEKGTGLYTIKFPDLNRKGKHDTFEEPLRKVIKNANKQLKETKKHFFNGDGTGLILFALNTFKSLSPEVVFRMICELLGEGFSSTDGFILCTPSWELQSDTTTVFNPVCTPATPFDSKEETIRSCYEIGEAWCKFYNEGGHH